MLLRCTWLWYNVSGVQYSQQACSPLVKECSIAQSLAMVSHAHNRKACYAVMKEACMTSTYSSPPSYTAFIFILIFDPPPMPDFSTVFVFGKGLALILDPNFMLTGLGKPPIVIADFIVFDAGIRSDSDRRV